MVVEGYSSTYTTASDPNPPYTRTNTYTLNQTCLWAYNADTGALLWGPINKDAAPIDLGPSNMVAANNKVFVVRNQKGYHDVSGTTGNCIVEAYQVSATNAPATSLLLE